MTILSLIFGMLFLLLPSLLLYLSYRKTATSGYAVGFPGGGLFFDIKYYSEKERNEFQETLTQLVDQAKG